MITQSEREDREVESLWQSPKVLAIDTVVRQFINKLWSRLLIKRHIYAAFQTIKLF